MKDDCSFAWFRIARAKGIGPVSLWEIYDSIERSGIQVSDLVSCQSLQDMSILKRLKSKLTSSLSQQDEDKIYREFERLENNRVKIIYPEFSDFPIKLKQFGRKYGIPSVLYARGYTPIANVPSISIDAAKTAINMNIPVFVLSPKCFDVPPEGNDDLIQLGGHEISPENGIDRILLTLNRQSMKVSQNPQNSLQLDLFTSASVN